MTRAIAGALLLAALTVAGCNDSCGGNCSAPTFDLSTIPMPDMRVVHDLAITSAGVVTVGAGAANAFAPATVTIQAGQSVTWNWVSGFHSVVSTSMPKAFADSPQQASGQYTATFATAGTYPYQCGIHGAMMTGTIVVE
jgi:plastocyanin